MIRSIPKNISRKFVKIVPGIKSRPKDIKMSSISNEFKNAWNVI